MRIIAIFRPQLYTTDTFLRAVAITTTHHGVSESGVYVYKGWKKQRTTAHNAHAITLLQLIAGFLCAQSPCAFTFPQVARAFSVRTLVRILRTRGEVTYCEVLGHRSGKFTHEGEECWGRNTQCCG